MIKYFSPLIAAALLSATPLIGGVPSDPGPETEAQVFDCSPGPWGRVQWHYIHLEAPEWIVENYPAPHTQPVWVFPGTDAAHTVKLLMGAGVGRETVDRWFADKRTLTNRSGATTLFPTAADVEGLSAPARAAIYKELAKYPQNEFFVNPVKILDADVDAWLGLRTVRPQIRELLKKLTYLEGSVLCFSDLPVLLSYAESKAEVTDLIKLFTRVRAVMAYLQVGQSDDTSSLDRYWTASFRRKDVLPMLHSISMLPGGGRIGFSHLLPSEPRKLIYTYPTAAMATTGRMPDCHWTALNFFNENPQNVFLDVKKVATEILEGYELVKPPYHYGDVLVFLNAAGQGMHSCVYLCDDLVFSKNGEAAIAPWIVCTLGDVKRIYSGLDVDHPRVFRIRAD